ncbi:hypothetical protein ACIBCN_00920 [Nocardia sp. NPDC051052]|uniref:hypothetical protein n=1 Tax=Nocardia sp. NPDC051052 TaxID=3364322 RepID=UPI0037B5D31C
MKSEPTNLDTEFNPDDPTLHLEYLYGPQWRDVAKIVERAAQLTLDEREQLNVAAGNGLQEGLSGLSGGAGLAGLFAGLGGASDDSQPAQIAAETAKEFGRARHIQIAGTIAGQAVSPVAGPGADDLSGLLKSLTSIGALVTVNRAVTAAALGDLVGRGKFTREVYDALMRPWSDTIR